MANEEVRHNAYLPGYNQVLHHELRTAENCAGYLIPVLKEKVALNPQLTLLDVGAGIGTITAGLAKYIPEGQITAFDLSSEVLERAANYAKDAGVHNIQFKSGNVFELPFPDESFDIVHMHQMLCHLSTPIPALKEMLRVTKPDGVVAVRECDMRMWSWWPLLPGLDKFFKIQLATHEGAGGSNLAGPQLISWAMKAGAKRDHIKMSYGSWCYSEPRERAGWGYSFAQRIREGGIGKKALEMGIATREELEEMAKAWEEWVMIEDASYGSMHGEILVQK